MNKKLLIVLLLVVVGICVFFAIHKKNNISDDSIVKTYEYEITKTFDCAEVENGVVISCECDVLMNNQHYKSSNTINTVSCDNQAKLCDDACQSFVQDLTSK